MSLSKNHDFDRMYSPKDLSKSNKKREQLIESQTSSTPKKNPGLNRVKSDVQINNMGIVTPSKNSRIVIGKSSKLNTESSKKEEENSEQLHKMTYTLVSSPIEKKKKYS